MEVSLPLFGCIIPGRPLISDFIPIDNGKYMTEVPHPAGITDMTFFLFPTCNIIPPNYGAVIYFSTAPTFAQWELLGSLTLLKPSGTFRTGWSSREDILSSAVIRIGISIESIEVIENLESTRSGVDDRFAYAHKIAIDLFQYMSSFAQEPRRSDLMVVPTNILDKWFERFERKYRLDPNFMLKNSI